MAGHGPEQLDTQPGACHGQIQYLFAWVQIACLVQTSVSIFYCGINVKPAVQCVKTTTAVYLFMILQLVKAW